MLENNTEHKMQQRNCFLGKKMYKISSFSLKVTIFTHLQYFYCNPNCILYAQQKDEILGGRKLFLLSEKANIFG